MVKTYLVKDMSKKNLIFVWLLKGILIQHPTRITCHTSTLIDHIITNCEEKVTQSGVINTLLSDHQLIFCTRKIKKVQRNNYKQMPFCSLKNYSMENFERELLHSQITKSLVTLTLLTIT